jgi:pre-mRNA-processing factor 19
LDLHDSHIVTGGNDKCVTVFNKDTEEIVASLKGHSKRVVAVACHPTADLVLSGSADSTVRVWHYPSQTTLKVIQAHDDQITGLSLHATGDYILSSSRDRSWAFSDLHTGQILAKVSPEDSHPLTSAKFHPDGLIFATGTSNADVKIWDLKEQINVADFPGHTAAVTAMSFSENGYYLATAAEDYTVRLWDLRKLKNFKTLTVEDKWTGGNDSIVDLSFDQSGSYLAFIGNDLRVYNSRTWNQVAVFAEHSGIGTGVRFGPSASFIVSSSMDRTVKIYGA